MLILAVLISSVHPRRLSSQRKALTLASRCNQSLQPQPPAPFLRPPLSDATPASPGEGKKDGGQTGPGRQFNNPQAGVKIRTDLIWRFGSMHAMDSRVNIHTSFCHSPSSAVARLYEEKCSNTATNPSEVQGFRRRRPR